jgi:hypothetical protein
VRIIAIKEARMLRWPHDLPPEKHALYVQARQIMGRPGGEHWDLAHRYLLDYSWREDEVRQAVDAPEDVEWFTRVLELEYHGLAGFRFYEAPEGSGADGTWEEGGRWRDQPLEAWGEFYIRAGGVLALARCYGEASAL